ncbi:MAG: YitT family protein [Bacteroidetes bacterium]|nr:YitT family protein [Bacteroidota bacterium]
MKRKNTDPFRALFNLLRTGNRYTRLTGARNAFEFKVVVRKLGADIFMMALGVLSAGFGLKSFLLSANFLDGGATGIALLISELSNIKLPLLLVSVNIPFILLGYRIISPQFALRTTICIVSLALCVAFFPYPPVPQDKLLVSLFGGFFLGAGTGLAVRGGAVIDGTEVLAIAMSKKSWLTIGDVIMVINVLVFSLCAWLISVEKAMYAMLTYLSAAKTVDYIIEGIEEYMGVTIISVKSERIRMMIIEKLGRGITVYNGERGFGKSGEKLYDLKILYTIITRLEISKLKLEINKIDPNAFMVMTSVKDIKGGMIKKRRHK